MEDTKPEDQPPGPQKLEAPQKPHVSATQINMYLRCPRQYAYRYLEGLKVRPSGAMIQGRVFAQAVERNYRQKIETRKDLPIDEVTDFFAQRIEDAIQEEDPIMDAAEGETPATLKDQGVVIAAVHQRQLAPHVQPVEVEEKVVLSLGDKFPMNLMVIRDVVDDGGIIIDNKAYAKTRNDEDLAKDLQLSTYALAYRIQFQKEETGLRLDLVLKTKEPHAQRLETRRTRDQLKLHLRNIGAIQQGIEKHVFPMNPTGWWCSEKMCGYWSRCMGLGRVISPPSVSPEPAETPIE